jgi:hypothetical protein
LAAATGSLVRTFAYPYGASPAPDARALVGDTYTAAFTTVIGRVTNASSRFALPRVDAHYVRDPRLLRRVVLGEREVYLRVRRMAAHTRRTVRKDYATLTVEPATP